MCLSVLAAPAIAAEQDVPALYLQQSRHGTCTLASAAMMVRSLLYRNGVDAWAGATEQDVGRAAWCSDGLIWSWTYSIDGNTVAVAHDSLSGISAGALEDLLSWYPEGIVLYCGNLPHAVFLTDCQDGVFYCADPITAVRTTLEDSYLGTYGSQEDILRHVTAYWYVASYSLA